MGIKPEIIDGKILMEKASLRIVALQIYWLTTSWFILIKG